MVVIAEPYRREIGLDQLMDDEGRESEMISLTQVGRSLQSLSRYFAKPQLLSIPNPNPSMGLSLAIKNNVFVARIVSAKRTRRTPPPPDIPTPRKVKPSP